jgi:hypothetical protein
MAQKQTSVGRLRVALLAFVAITIFAAARPLIPLGLLVRYTTGLDFFWLVVLSATYVCFALTLFSRRWSHHRW